LGQISVGTSPELTQTSRHLGGIDGAGPGVADPVAAQRERLPSFFKGFGQGQPAQILMVSRRPERGQNPFHHWRDCQTDERAQTQQIRAKAFQGWG
jgi:hypothetical protein